LAPPVHGASAAYLFQNFAFVSKYVAHTSNRPALQIPLIERSLYCDAHVFFSLLREDPSIVSELEGYMYDSWYHALMQQTGYHISGFAYLKTDPEVCFARVKQRHRVEEVEGIDKQYLERIHAKLEHWMASEHRPHAVLRGDVEFERDEENCAQMMESFLLWASRVLEEEAKEFGADSCMSSSSTVLRSSSSVTSFPEKMLS
jgi:deoxyadenosine/deoxycytidine kinase